MSITVVAIQNPGEETQVFRANELTPYSAAEQFGVHMKQGAFVALTNHDERGNTESVALFVVDTLATAEGRRVYLQNNERFADSDFPEVDIDDIGCVIGYADLAVAPLETYTVFGINDDRENFVAVITATPDTVEEQAVKAGLVDEGYESSVQIVAIFKGDQTDLENVIA